MSQYNRVDVLEEIKKNFPSLDQDVVLKVLDLYGVDPDVEPERDRVHMGMLKLSQGDFHELESLLEDAKSDYRDILYWSKIS
jgi:hypothetical protein